MRFVWKIDAQGIISELSDEFSATVGPHAANVVGLAFRDVAALFNLDPDGKISRSAVAPRHLVRPHHLWPVEGTDMVVRSISPPCPPIRATANSTASAAFGIIRVADSRPDPCLSACRSAPG